MLNQLMSNLILLIKNFMKRKNGYMMNHVDISFSLRYPFSRDCWWLIFLSENWWGLGSPHNVLKYLLVFDKLSVPLLNRSLNGKVKSTLQFRYKGLYLVAYLFSFAGFFAASVMVFDGNFGPSLYAYLIFIYGIEIFVIWEVFKRFLVIRWTGTSY